MNMTIKTLSCSKKAFTLLEIMLAIMIIWILVTALYIWVGPYMIRSRDTTRMVKVDTLMNVLDAFKKSADKFPSQFGVWWNALIAGYCLTELLNRPDGATVDMKFSAISKSFQAAPVDPLGTNAQPIWPCTMSGSYFYSILNNGINDETAILAARLESKSSANYGTGSDLSLSWMAQYLFLNTKRWLVPTTSQDAIYFRPSR